jgi:MFS transporter, SP family, solute carrier family 2 (myo-inositol transporter), member 13
MTNGNAPTHHKGPIFFLLFIAGMGGFLYGYDIGIIGAALLYLNKTIQLTIQQESLIVGAVLGGGMVSSLVAGIPAELFGRKKVMVAAAVMFVASVGLIVAARGFTPLFLGRALQGLSAGMIAVVIPLHLAEGLPAAIRGRGTALFQWLLTIGIFTAFCAGSHYTSVVDGRIRAGVSGAALVGVEDDAWRAMFVTSIYPAVIFLVGTFFVIESPRWLFRKGRRDQALAALRRTLAPAEAEAEFREMGELAAHEAGAPSSGSRAERFRSSLREIPGLFRRKYVVPFILACAVLGLTQATGVNSILQYIVLILQQAGMDPALAARSTMPISAVNCVFTILGFLLVDRLGRKGMLMMGTAGITASLVIGACAFHHVESRRVDVTASLSAAIAHASPGARVEIPLSAEAIGRPLGGAPGQLLVLYTHGGGGDLIASAGTRDPGAVLVLEGGPAPIVKKAMYGPIPGRWTGITIVAAIILFFASFATGPGVCVWLALTELMPTRIRSIGMGVGLLINQGISAGIAAVFLPFVGNYGYTSIFCLWAAFTLVFFLVAAFLLPETKGKSLEEIEASFER